MEFSEIGKKIFIFLRDPQIFCLLIIFAISIMIKTTVSFCFSSPFLFGDEVEYYTKASAIFHSQNIFATPPINDVFPGYPMVLLIGFFLSDSAISIYHSLLFVNIILSTITIFPAYFILKNYCSERISLIGSIILVTLPCLIVYEFMVVSENLFIPLFVFSCWFFIEFCKNKSRVFGILFFLSLIMLTITRPTGFIMVLSFFILIIFEEFMNLSKKIKIVTASIVIISITLFSIVLISLIIRTEFFIGPYDISKFLQLTIQSISSADSLLYILSLILYKFEYLILSGYCIFFILTCLLFFHLYFPKMAATVTKIDIFQSLTDEQQRTLKALGFYVFFTALPLIIISVFFNYRSGSIFKSITHQFDVYGRYIDPIVPLIFIFGIISLSILTEQIKSPSKSVWGIFLGLDLVILSLFNLTFPFILHDQYQISNNLAIWYLIDFKNIIPIWGLIAILFIVMTILMILGLYSTKLKYFFFLIVIITSVFIGSMAIMDEQPISSFRHSQNEIGRYLSENTHENTLLIIDSNSKEDFNYIWLATFLAKGPVQYYPIINESSLPGNNTNFYVMTSQSLNLSRIYFPIGSSTGGFFLYKPGDEKSNLSQPNKSLSTNGQYEYLWFEPENFEGITTHVSGWGTASVGFEPLSHKLALSASNSISNNNTIYLTTNISIKKDTYYYWVRSRVLSFSQSSFILEIDNRQFPYFRNKSDRDKWIWTNLGNSSLDKGQHSISLIKTIPSQKSPSATWAGVDMILITNNLTYIPVDGTMPPKG